MKIAEFMDLNELQKIQDQFSDATGLAAIAVDVEGNYITKGSNFTEFCMKYTRGCEKGLKRCVKCDTECRGTYYCHAGLMDFASDIIVEGEKVGGIIGGQVLPKAPEADQFAMIAGELGIDEKKYLEAVKKVPVKSEKEIRAAADLLNNVVNKLVRQAYYQKRDDTLITYMKSEIKKSTEDVNFINAKTMELESIASKQNILALNASIEAARCGDVGAGFAVVAVEMSKLSGKSASLYKDIRIGTDHIYVFVQKMQEYMGKSDI